MQTYGRSNWPLNECCYCCCFAAVEYSWRHGWFIRHRYGPGSGQIWLDDVVCNGDESHIDSCDHLPWGDHNCRYIEDVSVKCTTGMKFIAATQVNATIYCRTQWYGYKNKGIIIRGSRAAATGLMLLTAFRNSVVNYSAMSAELAEMVSVKVVINDKVIVFGETPILCNTFLRAI